MLRDWTNKKTLAFGLLVSTAVGVLLYAYSAHIDHSLTNRYLLWNLFLAWVPLIISTRLVIILRNKPWSSWEGMILSFLWLLFLPNSFYMISDFIHLQDLPPDNVIYYAITFTSIIYTAVILGFISLYMVHLEFKKRFNWKTVNIIIVLILASCSSAIYIGRDLRLNSWDVFTNPFAVIFDVSDRLIHLSDYPSVIAISGMFFLLLVSMYFLAWSGIKVINNQRV
ncbi:MAG: DUF1361 domain-containing protein [Candidatus Saccharimonadales bacterium]